MPNIASTEASRASTDHYTADAPDADIRLHMLSLSEDNPKLRDIPCYPMPFGHWETRRARGGHGNNWLVLERVFVPDPNVYLFGDRLFAHEDTIRRLGLWDARTLGRPGANH